MGSGRGPESKQAVAAPSAAAAAIEGRGSLLQQIAQQQQQRQVSGTGPVSPSAIHLTVASGAVVAPELEYTVGEGTSDGLVQVTAISLWLGK